MDWSARMMRGARGRLRNGLGIRTRLGTGSGVGIRTRLGTGSGVGIRARLGIRGATATGSGRRFGARSAWAAVGAGAVAAGCLSVAVPASATASTAATGSLRLSATNGGADASWAAPRASAPRYYRLSVTDLQTAASFTAVTNGPFTTTHLSGLADGQTYAVTVTGEPSGGIVGEARVTPAAAALRPAPGPPVESVRPATLAGGAPGLAVRLGAQPGSRYDVVAALTTDWKLAARAVGTLAPGGGTVVVGPLQPRHTYLLAVAGYGAAQSPARIVKATTGNAAGCTAAACVRVSAAAPARALTANGVLDTVPAAPETFARLHPAVFRLSTGYGSEPGAARSVAATGAALIENLADTWYDRTDSGLAGGAEPPWECWACYAGFVAEQVRSIEASGARPAYWEVENEPGVAGTYPAHLQGDAALYLRQLQVAATAIHSVDPSARILAPTDGAFLVGGANLNQPVLTLTAVLAHAGSIPGLAGLDWHENAAPADPALAAEDLASARTLAALAGRPGLGMVVSEYTTADDAPLAGAEAAWLDALTGSGVTYAARACWTGQPGLGTAESTCAGQLGDGLFTLAGQLTAPGVVDALYGRLGRAEAATSSSPTTFALAGTSGALTRVLLGREASCLPGRNPACPVSSTPSPGPETVQVSVARATPPTGAWLSRVPAGIGTTVTTRVPFSYAHGVVTVTLPLADGAAAELTVD